METAYYIVSIIGVVFDAILAAVAINISIKAISQTKTQIKLSNKHQLFDRRLEKYHIFDELFSCFMVAELFCLNERDLDKFSYSIILDLLDNPFLEDVKWAAKEPKGSDAREAISRKTRWLERTSIEIGIIFEKEEAKLISSFISELGYFIYYINDYNYWKCFPDEEENCRERLTNLFKIFQRVDEIYKQIDRTNSAQEILKQIKLNPVKTNEKTEITN